MQSSQTLLVEIGCEELPPQSLLPLAQSLHSNVCKLLQEARLTFIDADFFASPRRLAIKVQGLACMQPDRQVEKRGPSAQVAFDNEGNPSQAALGWAKGCGINIEDAQFLETDKGKWLLYRQTITGEKTVDLLPQLLDQALAHLPISKPMRWGNSRIQFVRPVQNLLMLFGKQVVPAKLLGQEAGPFTLGHRFMGPGKIEITDANDYPKKLQEQGYVIASFTVRKAKIKQGIEQAAQALGGIADLDTSLLDEVTALVEWPVVLTARFAKQFLDVPSQALVQTMKNDQKYFPVYDRQGNLLPHFIFVSNLASKAPQQIIAGNEKVVASRLADAQFFFQADRKQPLASYLSALHQVVFQKQLGTLGDRCQRIADLSALIAEKIGADPQQAKRAGLLSKCDLMTQMVSEFPEIQGVMGMHYAHADGETQAVARAIGAQYLPRFAGDKLPQESVSCAVALAEKIDTLTGIFGIGQLPKGDKDPFALRRAAIGVNRILIEHAFDVDLKEIFSHSISLYGACLSYPHTQAQLLEFIRARLHAWYLEQSIAADTLQSVMTLALTKPLDIARRIMAVTSFRQQPECAALVQANKRVSNILNKQGITIEATGMVDPSLCQASSEQTLYQAMTALQATLTSQLQASEYTQALATLAQLRPPIDDFFEQVMVMDENQQVRENRLRLLVQLRTLFLKVADLACLQG